MENKIRSPFNSPAFNIENLAQKTKMEYTSNDEIKLQNDIYHKLHFDAKCAIN